MVTVSLMSILEETINMGRREYQYGTEGVCWTINMGQREYIGGEIGNM